MTYYHYELRSAPGQLPWIENIKSKFIGTDGAVGSTNNKLMVRPQ